jgi:hypothetical protein
MFAGSKHRMLVSWTFPDHMFQLHYEASAFVTGRCSVPACSLSLFIRFDDHPILLDQIVVRHHLSCYGLVNMLFTIGYQSSESPIKIQCLSITSKSSTHAVLTKHAIWSFGPRCLPFPLHLAMEQELDCSFRTRQALISRNTSA